VPTCKNRNLFSKPFQILPPALACRLESYPQTQLCVLTGCKYINQLSLGHPSLERVAHVDPGQLGEGGVVSLVAQEIEARAEGGAPGKLAGQPRRGAPGHQCLEHLGAPQPQPPEQMIGIVDGTIVDADECGATRSGRGMAVYQAMVARAISASHLCCKAFLPLTCRIVRIG